MTPMRAKRNSKAPERFTSDEAKVDAINNHVKSKPKQGDKSNSTTKSMPVVREPLKVKLPKLKRPHPTPRTVAAPESSTMQITVEKKVEPNSSGIRCPCGVDDDLGVMVECEKCSTWQHGYCINVGSEEDAYEGYVCGYCLFPSGKHTESLHQLTLGDKFQSKFDNLELFMRRRTEQNVMVDENRVEFTYNELEQAVQDLRRVFNCLKVKWELLTNDDYTAELKIWQHPIWSDNPEENLKQQLKQTVSFVGDIYKSNLRLHLSNLLSNMQRRCQLIRYQIMETQAPGSKLDTLLMILDDISKVVERYSEEIRQN
jgi:hypothetical protein